ncbi:MAG: ABC transporter permease [Actinomycetota bacterium]
MARYIVKRTLYAGMTILLAIVTVFLMFFVLPGGAGKKERGPGEFSPVAVLIAGRNTEPDRVRRIEENLGLDRPLSVQLGRYLWNALHGDLGRSFAANAPVTAMVMGSVAPTVQLALGASIVWLVVGVGIGTLAALRRRALPARAAMGFALVSMSMPVFLAGILAILLFDRTLGIYEANTYVPFTTDPLGWLRAMWVPWLALAFTFVGLYARMARGALVEVEHEDYLRTAAAKGLESSGIVRHQMRAGLSPIVTMYGLDLGILLGGSIIIETVFNIPGLGNLALGALNVSDLPVIAGITVIAATFITLANLVVDVLYALLDPRVRYT